MLELKHSAEEDQAWQKYQIFRREKWNINVIGREAHHPRHQKKWIIQKVGKIKIKQTIKNI